MNLSTSQILIGVAILVAVVAGIGYMLKWRKDRIKANADAFWHFNCPGCKRRLRYRARQVGNTGKCSHCGSAVTFPPVSQSVD